MAEAVHFAGLRADLAAAEGLNHPRLSVDRAELARLLMQYDALLAVVHHLGTPTRGDVDHG